MGIGELLDGVGKTLSLIAGTPATAILSAAGLLLLALAALFAYKTITKKPEETSSGLRAGLFICLVGGMLFSAAGPALALFWVAQSPMAKVNTDKALTSLEKNDEVQWLIRLVPFDQKTDPGLSIDRLTHLGPPNQQFSFVAAYEDLVGVNVREVIRMTGGNYTNARHVSVIMFPRRTQLYPASARGLLQVIQEIENRKDIVIDKPFLRDQNQLSAPEIADLNDKTISSYRFERYKDKFRRYCELAHKFRCDRTYTARDYIGDINIDWHPLGFSQKEQTGDPCGSPTPDYCAISDWNAAKTSFRSKFGSRAFFVRNLEIGNIPDRILLDVSNAAHQVVPDIGLR
jgi:hypothetical protein